MVVPRVRLRPRVAISRAPCKNTPPRRDGPSRAPAARARPIIAAPALDATPPIRRRARVEHARRRFPSLETARGRDDHARASRVASATPFVGRGHVRGMTSVARRRRDARSRALVTLVTLAWGVLASIARAAAPTVRSSPRVYVAENTRAALAFAGSDADGDTVSTLVIEYPDYGDLYLDEGLSTSLEDATVTCGETSVTGKLVNSSQTAFYVAQNCSASETRTVIDTQLKYRLVDGTGANASCSDESTVYITVRVYDAKLSRFVRACNATWVTISESTGEVERRFPKQGNSTSVMYGWGDNAMAQLGLGDTTNHSLPVTNVDFTKVKQLAYIAATSSGETMFGIESATGYVWGWGHDARGILGVDQTLANSSAVVKTPTRIGSLEKMRKIALGEAHAVAVSESGQVFTWGSDDFGQLGRGWMPGMLQRISSDSFRKSKSLPAQVVNNGIRSKDATDVAAGDFHTLVLTSKGEIWAWGSNVDGQLGLKACEISKYGDGIGGCSSKAPEMPYTDSPQLIKSSVNFTAVDASARYSMAIGRVENDGHAAGQLYTWGLGESGQLGLGKDGELLRATFPKRVTGYQDIHGTKLSGVKVIFAAAGESHAATVSSDGDLYTWGSNTFGQLGHGDRVSRYEPTKVQALSDANIKVHWVSCGRSHTVVVSDSGEVFTWGSNEFGQLGLERRADNTQVLTVRGWQASSAPSGRRRLLAVYGSTSFSEMSLPIYERFAAVPDALGRVGASNADVSAIAMGAARPFKEGYLSNTEVGLYGEIEYVSSPVIVNRVQQVSMVVAAGGSSFALRLSCDVGYERDRTTGRCVPCTAGTFTSDYTSFLCQPCPHGHYQNETATSSCKLCEAGTYAATTSASQCTKCAAGTFLPFKGSFSSEYCINCPKGSRSSEGSGACVLCGKGEYQDEVGKPSCKKCGAGFFNDKEGATDLTACIPCPPGNYSMSEGSERCEPCPAGEFSKFPGASRCNVCGLESYGNYSTGGAAECTPCPTGTRGGNVTEAAEMRSIDDCIPCEPGTFVSEIGQKECRKCDRGTFSDTTGATACTKCEVGYQGRPDADVENRTSPQNSCMECPIGKYNAIKGKDCVECSPGTYQDRPGQAKCEPCPVGTFAPSTGAITQSDCINCAAGYYAPHEGMSRCLKCPMGQYGAADRTSTATCDNCPDGTFSNEIGSTDASACTPCTKGYYSETGEPCQECGVGTYQDETAQGACKNCPAGTYLNSTGGTDSSNCTKCAVGTFSDTVGSSACTPCDAGYYASEEGMVMCDLCPFGTYSNLVGAISSDACLKCPAGSTSTSEGASECAPCIAGTFSVSEGSTECERCPAGSYSNAEGATTAATCLPCDAGYFTDIAGSSQCSPCPAGTYATDTGSIECTPCPIGTSSDAVGATSESTCMPCAAGTYSDVVGSVECFSCLAGTYMEFAGNSSCDLCPAGTYSNVEASDTVNNCLQCIPGQYSFEGATTCAECEPGTYTNSSGMASCDGCPPGTYGTETGGTSMLVCLNCPIGQYSEREAAQSCDPCPRGTFSSAPGASACSPCSPGTYGTVEGATTGDGTVCRPCPTGQFSGGGRATCTPCGVGTFADVTGLANCTLCPEGTYGVTVGAKTSAACELCPLYHFNSTPGSTSIEACTYFHSGSNARSFIAAILVLALALTLLAP